MKIYLYPIVVILTIAFANMIAPAYETYILENCDAKFGCDGGVSFSFYLGLLAGIISALSSVLSRIALNKIFKGIALSMLFREATFSGIVLGLILPKFLGSGFGIAGKYEVVGMFLSWFLLSLVISALILIVLRWGRKLTSKSSWTASPPTV